MLVEFSLDSGQGRRLASKSCRPHPTRVQNVPLRSRLIISPAPWIMVAKTINDRVPERFVCPDKVSFDCCYKVSLRVF